MMETSEELCDFERSGGITTMRRDELDPIVGKTTLITRSGAASAVAPLAMPTRVNKIKQTRVTVDALGGEVGPFNINKVLGNSLIVERICSLVRSPADLITLRLVNHLFQKEATKRLRLVHKSIRLDQEICVAAFLELMENRKKLKLVPFPFSRFKPDLSLQRETLQNFYQAFGPHIESLNVSVSSTSIGKLAILLSYSPQLRELEFFSNEELYLFDEDLRRLPASFPSLKVLVMTACRRWDYAATPDSQFPLVDFLVHRANHLKRIKIPSYSQISALRILRFLAQNRSNNLPNFSFTNYLTVTPNEISVVQELMNLSWRFTRIQIELQGYFTENDNDVRRMFQKVGTWLEMQTNSLTYLGLTLQIKSHGAAFQFTELSALKELFIEFPNWPPNSRPIFPFIFNPFPVLERLWLSDYRHGFGIFGTSTMPSVKELNIYSSRSSVSEPSWQIVFPNLTSLNIELDSEKDVRSTLRFILTHFIKLVHLDLYSHPDTDPDYGSRCDYWNLLTGGAPRCKDNLRLLSNDILDQDVGGAQEPSVNGIYSVPSLRNMRDLKTLGLCPRFLTNLNGILYMSRTGQLVPLEKLKLTFEKSVGPFQDESQMRTYEKARFHTNVSCLRK